MTANEKNEIGAYVVDVKNCEKDYHAKSYTITFELGIGSQKTEETYHNIKQNVVQVF